MITKAVLQGQIQTLRDRKTVARKQFYSFGFCIVGRGTKKPGQQHHPATVLTSTLARDIKENSLSIPSK
ncbi:hypothetical protein JTE90_016916 [Oedothorax gibbosus]|uniref:Uncharacterized protein n=1 Tax=Oedothorax gibbosus TaxID=931172 RepID=A0AAV6UU60_9ARAC|nr:hypothetical protein JTE90_016916 [Oedothorax gibbosus]